MGQDKKTKLSVPLFLTDQDGEFLVERDEELSPSVIACKHHKTSSPEDESQRRKSISSAEQISSPPKKISFAESCDIKFVLHIRDYSTDEIAACWYNESECVERKKKYTHLVSKMLQGRGHNYCIRGLEYMPREAMFERQRSRMKVLIAVLREQDKQILMQIDDQAAIARKYQEATVREGHEHIAYAFGLDDEVTAMNILEQMSEGYRRIGHPTSILLDEKGEVCKHS